MKLLDKSILSPREDLIAFTTFIPVYLLYLLLFQFNLVSLPSSPPYYFFLLGWLIVDGSHVYSTLLVSYMDRTIFQNLKWVLILTPLLLYVLTSSLFYFGQEQVFAYFLAYLAMIHFIRQEFGWMKIATRLDAEAPTWLNHVDKIVSYIMTIAPMMWFMRKANSGFWYKSGDLFLVPDDIAYYGFSLFWPAVIVFLAVNGYHTYKTQTFNLTKFLVFINTFFGWYIAKTQTANIYLAVWLVIFHHGIPYYFIVFKTEKISGKYKLKEKLKFLHLPILYLSCVGIFYLFMTNSCCSSAVGFLKTQGNLIKALVLAIAPVPQMTHFILDGFIWKRKRGLVTK